MGISNRKKELFQAIMPMDDPLVHIIKLLLKEGIWGGDILSC